MVVGNEGSVDLESFHGWQLQQNFLSLISLQKLGHQIYSHFSRHERIMSSSISLCKNDLVPLTWKF